MQALFVSGKINKYETSRLDLQVPFPNKKPLFFFFLNGPTMSVQIVCQRMSKYQPLIHTHSPKTLSRPMSHVLDMDLATLDSYYSMNLPVHNFLIWADFLCVVACH